MADDDDDVDLYADLGGTGVEDDNVCGCANITLAALTRVAHTHTHAPTPHTPTHTHNS